VLQEWFNIGRLALGGISESGMLRGCFWWIRLMSHIWIQREQYPGETFQVRGRGGRCVKMDRVANMVLSGAGGGT
jgi:hypothetical protein